MQIKHINFKKVIAFSLVELMVALVVVSCITAALSPVITKKLKSSAISIGATGETTTDCSNFSDNCDLCDEDGCLVCKNTCSVSQYLNIPDCTCQSCSEGCEKCIDATTCEKCLKGYKLSSGVCSQCDAGTYGDNGYTCESCPAGQYQNNAGQEKCLPCAKGYYSSSANSQSCTPCAAGTYSNKTGSTSCTPCSIGYYSSSEGATACTKCASGTYANEIGMTTCKTCSVDYSCTSTSHIPCGAYYGANAGDTTCSACTTANCVDCNTPSNCVKCASGFLLASGTSCKQCEIGTLCNGLIATGCATGYEMVGGVCTKTQEEEEEEEEAFTYTYSGASYMIESDVQYIIYLTTSGNFIPSVTKTVSLFLVGGGGGGGGGCQGKRGGARGCGGLITEGSLIVSAGSSYAAVVGAGGNAGHSSWTNNSWTAGKAGGDTSFASALVANGGVYGASCSSGTTSCSSSGTTHNGVSYGLPAQTSVVTNKGHGGRGAVSNADSAPIAGSSGVIIMYVTK